MLRITPVLLLLALIIIYDSRASPPPNVRVYLALGGFFLVLAALASLAFVH